MQLKTRLITVLTFFLLAIGNTALSQHLIMVEHGITGEKSRETTWEAFLRKGFKTRGYEVDCRFRRDANDSIFFEISNKNQIRSHFIDEGDVMGFYGDNDSLLVVLKCIDGISTRDIRDFGIYKINISQMEVILNNNIKDVKMEYQKGYVLDGLTERKLLELRNAIMLITMKKRFDDKPVVIKNRKR